MDRRSILRLLIGGATVGATGGGVAVSAAATALGVDKLTAGLDECVGAVGGSPPGVPAMWRIRNIHDAHRYAKSKPAREMPPHISAMRSWSPAYKASIHAREEAILAAFRQRLDDDESFADRFIKEILGENG
jgi:hypothetical protein